jgi:sn-glycerol 3-phosphate transport system ATP-binding protein
MSARAVQNPFVTVEGITKTWNGQLGVRNISLEIPRGAFVALLGPSGCGKSTTLRLIAGLETPDSGTIRIDGRDVTAAPASARGLSMVFQSYALFPHLDVAENVLFGLKVRRVPKAEQRAKLRQALEMTGLAGLERRKPGAISGGQRQRVALARAIVAGHPLCLMDEPLSNLDAKLRHSVRRDIKKLQRDLGMTVLYVTHDQTEAMSMSDIVVLMKDGQIEQAGRPVELYEHPASTFVAGFVGSPPMALIDAHLLPEAARAAPCDPIFGIRPEHLRLAQPGRGRLRAVITHCEYMGSETFLSFEEAGTTGLTVRLPGAVGMAVGEVAELGFDPKHLHMFEKSTGSRVASATSKVAHSGRSQANFPTEEMT